MYLLGETIQSDTHDSTEDAQAALKLYFKYKELNVDKKAKIEVIDLYEKGKCFIGCMQLYFVSFL